MDTKDKDHNPNLINAFVDAYASSLQFYARVNKSFLEALSVPFADTQEELREIKEEIKKQDKLYFASFNDYTN
jgi:hypothetical protein